MWRWDITAEETTMSWLILIGVIIGMALIVEVVGSIKSKIDMVEAKAETESFYDARRTHAPYYPGDFYSNGDHFNEGMVVSTGDNGKSGRCVRFNSGEWDYEIENLPSIYDPTLPTIEELETIAELSSRFLDIRRDYAPGENHSLIKDRAGKPKIYPSSSFIANDFDTTRLFYDMANKKRLVAKKKGEGCWVVDKGYGAISYFYRVFMVPIT